jgi:glyoxylase-like metal-dependent hydrolase (beta-lactamase superfamily II)
MMSLPRSSWYAVAVTTFAISSAVSAQRAGKPLAEEVARAMGGRNNVLGVRTILLTGTGENYNLGQNRAPDVNLPVWAVTKYVRALDLENGRWRQDQTREPRFPTGNTAPQRQRVGFDVVGYDITSDTSMRRVGARPTLDRRAELIYHPVGFVRAALQPGAQATEIAARGRMRALRLVLDGETYTMLVNGSTRLPLRIERTIHNGMLGDVVVASEFSEWVVASGLRLPMHVVQRIDDRWPLSDLKFTAAGVNTNIGDLAIPESVKTAELQAPQVTVAVDSVAPGVWFIGGGSHHSVAIEMKDHLLLVESPQGEERTLAVIRRARELRPGKPVRAVINTHHHFDHSGGVRAAMSEGLTVITHARNKAFYEALAKRRFSVVPDQLAKSPKPVRVEGVTSKRILTDGTRTVELHEILGSPHSESMLVVYLPAEKLLVEADLYTPQAANVTTPPVAPFAKGLVENIDRLGLGVETLIPIHGRVVPMSDLRKVAAAGS